jgi:hypothetical protein
MNLNSRTSSGIRVLDRTNLVSPLISNSLRANGPGVSIQNFDTAEINTISNTNGELLVNNVSATSPIESQITNGVANVSLNIQNPLSVSNNSLVLDFDDTLVLNNSQLSVVSKEQVLEANIPIVVDSDNKINLDFDNTLSLVNNQLHVDQQAADPVQPPIVRDETTRTISLDFGKGLELDSNNALVTNLDEIIKPLGALSSENIADISLNDAISLGFESLSSLVSSVPDASVDILKLTTSSDFNQKGNTLTIASQGAANVPYFGALDGLNTRDVFQFNETLSTLSVPHVTLNANFSPAETEAATAGYVSQYIQGTAGGAIDVSLEENGKRLLTLRTDATLAVNDQNNVGVNVSPLVDNTTIRVVQGQISNGITYSAGLTLTEAEVTLTPTTTGAITYEEGAFGENLTASKGVQRLENEICLNITSSNSQILVDNETGSISGNISTTGSGLSLNESVIALNLSELIDGNTITLYNGKLTGNLYHFGDAFTTDIQADGNNSVTLDLLAGEGISISGNTISANSQQTTYTAGPGLSLIGNEFSNALTITAGLGIIVAGSPETGYIISAEALQTQKTDDDSEQKTDNDTEQTLDADSNPEVVESIGAISSIVPIALTPLGAVSPIAIAPAEISGGLYGLLGGLAAASGSSLFGTLWGYEKTRRTIKNPDGTVETDTSGNPVYDLDPNGNYQFDPVDGTNLSIIENKTTRVSQLLFDSIQLPTYPEQAMNYSMCWDFETLITRPWIVSTATQLVSPILAKQNLDEIQIGSNTTSISTNSTNITNLQNAQSNYLLTSVYTPDQSVINTRLTTLESNSPVTVSGDLLKNGNSISIAPNQVNTSSIVDLAFNTRRLIPYGASFTDASPSTTTLANLPYANGTYSISTSSLGPNSGYKGWKSYFPEMQRTYLWLVGGYASGLYNGTTSTTLQDSSVISGEWNQIQLPVATSITSVRLSYRNSGQGNPTSISVLGSNDGTTWYSVVPISSLTWISNNDIKWVNSTNSTSYSYFRFIILATTNTGYANSGCFIEYFSPYGGSSFQNQLSLSSNLSASSATFSGIVSAASIPTDGSHLINKLYGDGSYSTIANLGITNTNVTNLTSRVASDEATIGNIQSTYATISGLSAAFSVNSNQTQITTLGTLTGLVSAGIVNITNTTASNSTNTGALIVSGGLGLAGAAYIGSNLSVSGTSSFTGTVTIPTPINTTDAATKLYVDTLSYVTAGTGLTKTGATVSINASQPQITSVGTLSSLTTTGPALVTNTTVSSSSTTGALIVSGGSGIAGSVYIGGKINVTGTSTFIGIVTIPTPVNTTDAATKLYVDTFSYVTAGTGLTKTGATLSVNASQPQITSVGTLVGLVSSGSATFSSTLGVTGLTTLGSLSAGASTLGTITGTSATFSSTLGVTGLTTLGSLSAGASTLGTITGTSATFSSTLGVTGATTLGSLSAGASTLGAITGTSATFSSTLGVTGATTLGSLSAGASTLGTITGTSATFSSTLGVTGATTLGSLSAGASTLGAITGTSATFSSTLGVTGATTLGSLSAGTSTLGAITGTSATFSSNLTLTGSLGGVMSSGSLNFSNLSFGFCNNGGSFFYNTIQGDGVFRNVSYNIRMGTSSAYSNLDILQNGNVVVNTTAESSSLITGALQIAGGVGIAKSLTVGLLFSQVASSIADTTTAASGTNATSLQYHTINAPTLTATNTGVVRTNAATMYISGAPIAGTNTTITNAYALQIANGSVSIGSTIDSTSTTGALQIAGGVAIAKSLTIGGSFLPQKPTFIMLIQQTSQTFNSAVSTAVLYQSSINYAGATTSTTSITLPISGTYRIQCGIQFSSIQIAYENAFNNVTLLLSAGSNSQLQCNVIPLFTSSQNYGLTGTFFAYVLAGQAVSLSINPSEGLTSQSAPTNSSNYGGTYLACEWIGP